MLHHFLFYPPLPTLRPKQWVILAIVELPVMKQCGALFLFCFFVQPMGYGPRMQQPSSQSQFLPQAQFSAQGMSVTNMPLAPSGGQAPVSQVCLTNGFF